jgi:glycosyltransferase involved in cell wall biosynthesis
VVPWIEVPLKGGPVALASCVRVLRKRMRQWGGVDVLHCHYRRPTLVARGLQVLGGGGLGRSRKGNLPALYTLHLSDLDLSWGRRLVSDFGDHTHVASTEGLDWVTREARVPRERVSLVPHGVHLQRFPVTTARQREDARRQLGAAPGDRVGVYVGRLDQRHPKNCPWLLDLAAAWGQRRQGLRIYLAGEGPDFGELQARIDHEGLSDRVQLLGHRDALEVYRAADLLLLPSGREGFSLVCAEAMCTGVPVLRTRTAGTTETIVEGETGRSVPVDREAFIRAALEMLGDGELLDSMREKAAEHVRKHLTFERQLRDTLAMYRRLAEG